MVNTCVCVKDLSLSSFLVNMPTKKQSAGLSEASHPATTFVVVTQSGSLPGSVVHFTESSRDSAVLAGVSCSNSSCFIVLLLVSVFNSPSFRKSVF